MKRPLYKEEKMQRNIYKKGVSIVLVFMTVALTACAQKKQNGYETETLETQKMLESQSEKASDQKNETSEEAVWDSTPEPTPDGISVEELESEYETFLIADPKSYVEPTGSEIFLGWNNPEGYRSLASGNMVAKCVFENIENPLRCVSIDSDGYIDVYPFGAIWEKYLLEDGFFEDFNGIQYFETRLDNDMHYYVVLDIQRKDTVDTPFGNLDIYHVKYGQEVINCETGEPYIEPGYYSETYEAEGIVYDVMYEEYAVIKNLGHKALIYGGLRDDSEYNGRLKEIIPLLFNQDNQ